MPASTSRRRRSAWPVADFTRIFSGRSYLSSTASAARRAAPTRRPASSVSMAVGDLADEAAVVRRRPIPQAHETSRPVMRSLLLVDEPTPPLSVRVARVSRRLQAVRLGVLRLVEQDLPGSRHLEARREPKPISVTWPENSAPLASSAATVASMSSHISATSWCSGYEYSGPHASRTSGEPHLARSVLKMSQPEPAPCSTYGQPEHVTEERSRVASGSSE